jgi:BlaI family penicillinase repressor
MTKRQLRTISPAETEILRLVWQRGAATVQQVCDSLPRERDIAYATVQTLLRRLEKKRYLKHRTDGKAHVFYPAAKREDVITRSVNDFLGRLFGGDPIPLMHYLAEHGRITAEDIEALKRLIQEKE